MTIRNTKTSGLCRHGQHWEFSICATKRAQFWLSRIICSYADLQNLVANLKTNTKRWRNNRGERVKQHRRDQSRNRDVSVNQVWAVLLVQFLKCLSLNFFGREPRLYKRVCPSVGQLLRWLVRWLFRRWVGRSVGPFCFCLDGQRWAGERLILLRKSMFVMFSGS